MVSKEAIEKRIAQLESERAQLVANATAYDGALQEANYWLAIAKKAEAEKLEPPKPE